MIDWDSYFLFRSSDETETAEKTATVLSRAAVSIEGRGQTLDARVDHVSLGRLALIRLGYQANVKVTRGLGDFFLVALPLTGRALFTIDSQDVELTRQTGAVLSPSAVISFRADTDYRQVLIRLESERVERFWRSEFDRDSDCHLHFTPTLNMLSPAGKQWRSLLAFLTQSEHFVQSVQQYEPLAVHLEDMVMSLLFATQEMAIPPEHDQGSLRVAPHYVKRALNYMVAHPDETLTLTRLAEIAGVSRRSLLVGFQRYRGVSPMAALRDIRLDRAHELLRNPTSPLLSVTEAAFDSGFAHLSNFSRTYRARYGELPSDTLARGKRSLA